MKKRQHHKKASGLNQKKRDPHRNRQQKKYHENKDDNIYEKRYFDYLPSETEQSQDDELTYKVVDTFEKLPSSKQNNQHNRRRRDLAPENNAESVVDDKETKDIEVKNVDKRQAQQLLSSHYFIENERRGSYYNPHSQGYYYQVPSIPFAYPQPSRQYLPISVNPYYNTYHIIPSYSYQIFPQNHISYHNPGTPPVNPIPDIPIQVIPQKPDTRPGTKPGVIIDDRFGEDGAMSFTDDDGRYIWGAKVDDTVYAACKWNFIFFSMIV